MLLAQSECNNMHQSIRSVKEIERLCGISRYILHRYEKAGLITPSGKNKYGYLQYDEDTVSKIVFIRFCQTIRFELKDIKEMLSMPRSATCELLSRQANVLTEEMEAIEKSICKLKLIIAVADSDDADRQIERIILEGRKPS